MNPLHERYLLGELSDEEQRKFEQDLANDQALRSRFEEDRALFELLTNQMLRRKIQAALATDLPATTPKSHWKTAGWVLVALLLVWCLWQLIPWKNSAGPQQPPPSTPRDTSIRQIPVVQTPPDTSPAPQNRQGRRMARADVEPHPIQNLRGQADRTPWTDLVDSIWKTPFPPANHFAGPFQSIAQTMSKGNPGDALLQIRELEPTLSQNDTLLFLKGFCLMELSQGDAALRNFNRISRKTYSWQKETEWCTAQCFLLMGEKEKARAVFKKLASKPGETFYPEAQKALRLLE